MSTWRAGAIESLAEDAGHGLELRPQDLAVPPHVGAQPIDVHGGET
ncbi:hypothetical protein [Streptomyces sp. NPDC059455]